MAGAAAVTAQGPSCQQGPVSWDGWVCVAHSPRGLPAPGLSLHLSSDKLTAADGISSLTPLPSGYTVNCSRQHMKAPCWIYNPQGVTTSHHGIDF